MNTFLLLLVALVLFVFNGKGPFTTQPSNTTITSSLLPTGGFGGVGGFYSSNCPTVDLITNTRTSIQQLFGQSIPFGFDFAKQVNSLSRVYSLIYSDFDPTSTTYARLNELDNALSSIRLDIFNLSNYMRNNCPDQFNIFYSDIFRLDRISGNLQSNISNRITEIEQTEPGLAA
jgi:hypothetical protein